MTARSYALIWRGSWLCRGRGAHSASSVAATPNLSTWTSRSNLAAPSISAGSSGGQCSRKSAFPRDRAPADRLNFRPLPSKANGRSFCPMSNRLRRGLSRQRTQQHANKPSDIQSRFRGSNGQLHCDPIRTTILAAWQPVRQIGYPFYPKWS